MAIAPLHLPAPAGQADPTRHRVRPQFLAARGRRHEPFHVGDPLATPSEIALRSAGVVHRFHR